LNEVGELVNPNTTVVLFSDEIYPPSFPLTPTTIGKLQSILSIGFTLVIVHEVGLPEPTVICPASSVPEIIGVVVPQEEIVGVEEAEEKMFP